jgi:glutamate dehydrogenase/leucine dehydrogenase
MKALGRDLANAKVIVQGFGNVGAVTAAALAQMGARVVGVSDVAEAVYAEQGLDVTRLAEATRKNKSLRNCGQGRTVLHSDLLEMPCDILVPAATANQITTDNAERIQAKVIAEGANGPTTPEADAILHVRDIFVIPDILCNAGGVFVSYLEYAQEAQQEQMTEGEVYRRLEARMMEKFREVFELARARNLLMREAALYLALKTVCSALVARGAQP